MIETVWHPVAAVRGRAERPQNRLPSRAGPKRHADEGQSPGLLLGAVLLVRQVGLTGLASGGTGSTVVSIVPADSEDVARSHHQRYQAGEPAESRRSKKMPSVLEDMDDPPTSFTPIQEVQ